LDLGSFLVELEPCPDRACCGGSGGGGGGGAQQPKLELSVSAVGGMRRRACWGVLA